MKAGRTKRRMARLIGERLDITLDPDEFWYNSNAEQAGCARWGIWAIISNRNTSIYSWDTMTECLQKGFVLSQEDTGLICVVVNDPA